MTYQQPDTSETGWFWTKIWQPPQKNNEKTKWINNMTKELEVFEESPKTEIHTDLLKTTHKKIKLENNGHGFWVKKFTSIHDWLALEMNRCLRGAYIPEWMTQGKTTLIQKKPNKGTTSDNCRSITCLPMMWKILIAQKKRSRGLFPEEQKLCCKRSSGIAELLYIDQHTLNENKTRRKNPAMARIDKNVIWYRPTKLDNKLPQNIQNITWSHKVYRENHENLESGIDIRRKKLSWSKDPSRYISTRCTISVTIHDCHDAT